MRHFIWLALLALFMTGCASTPIPESEKPAVLETFTPSLSADVKWSRSIGAWSEGLPTRYSPAIAHDHIYVVDGRNTLWAFDLNNGNKLWHKALKKKVTSAVSVSKDALFVACKDGEVLALSQNKGELLWRAVLLTEILTSPTVGEGRVAVRTVDGKLHVLDEKTGLRRWVYESSMPTLTLRGTSGAIINEGNVFAGFDNGKLAAFDLESGKLLWESTVAMPEGRGELERMVDIDADPLLEDSAMYAVAYQGRLVAMTRETGRILWARGLSSYRNIAMLGEVIYVVDTQSHILALNRRGGGSLWQQDKLHMRALSAPVVHHQALGIADFEGYLHWLSLEDGRLLSRYQIDAAGIIGTPLAQGDMLYVIGKSGVLKALKLKAPPASQ